MIDAKLTKLVDFFGKRLDNHRTESEFDRGAYVAYSIAFIMTKRLLYDLLDKQLGEDLEDAR